MNLKLDKDCAICLKGIGQRPFIVGVVKLEGRDIYYRVCEGCSELQLGTDGNVLPYDPQKVSTRKKFYALLFTPTRHIKLMLAGLPIPDPNPPSPAPPARLFDRLRTFLRGTSPPGM